MIDELQYNKVISDFYCNYTNNFEIYFLVRKDDRKDKFDSFYCHLDKVKKEIESKYKGKIEELQSRNIREYDVITTEVDTIEVIPSTEVPCFSEVNKLTNRINAKKAGDIDVKISDIWAIAYVYKNSENKKLIVFRKFTTPKTLNECKKLSIVGGNLKEIKADIFTIDYKIDAIYVEGNIYVVNKYYFERIFSFDLKYVKYVEESIEKLRKENVIENFDEFTSRCLESGNLSRKLVYVVANDRLKWLKKNLKSAKEVIEEYDLKVTVENDKVVFSKKECKISDVMRLITGCCVKDAVDMHKYFASGVQEV